MQFHKVCWDQNYINWNLPPALNIPSSWSLFHSLFPPSPASRPLFQSRRVSIVSLPPQKPRRSREPMLLNIWWFGRGLLFQMLAEWERMNSLARQVLLDQSVLRIGDPTKKNHLPKGAVWTLGDLYRHPLSSIQHPLEDPGMSMSSIDSWDKLSRNTPCWYGQHLFT